MPDLAHERGLLQAALQLLTRLPIPPSSTPHTPDTLRHASRYFPLAGLLIGLAAAAAFLAARQGLPAPIAALAALATTLLLTGALHEDGLADCCDGLVGGRDRASALRIMRDSRVGAFAVLGLIVVVGAKLAALATLPNAAAALLAAHPASRLAMVAVTAALPYARDSGTASPPLAATVASPARTDLLLAAAFGLPPLLLLGPQALPALIFAALVATATAAYARHRLGGYTGDVLGAVQQLTEATILVTALWHAA